MPAPLPALDSTLVMLERWIAINSFTGNLAGCNAMADALVEGFDGLGLRVRRVAGQDSGDHLVWTTAAWDALTEARGVVLAGHHDTVFPPGTFEGMRRDGGDLRGPGVLDMKGGLFVIWRALRALADAGELAALPLALVSVADEETGSVDGAPVIEALARRARAGLVFEAGRRDDSIVTRRKGTGKLSVKVTGRAAHAGNDLSAGINAIWALARFVDGVQRLTRDDGAITVNVGTIAGGTSANTVPAEARCEIDLRVVAVRHADDLVRAIDELARELGDASGARFQLTGGIRRRPLERSDASGELAALYGGHAARYGLSSKESPLVGGGSDANTLAACGVAVIDGLGPRGSGFHTHDERAELSTFDPRTLALLDTLRTLGTL